MPRRPHQKNHRIGSWKLIAAPRDHQARRAIGAMAEPRTEKDGQSHCPPQHWYTTKIVPNSPPRSPLIAYYSAPVAFLAKQPEESAPNWLGPL